MLTKLENVMKQKKALITSSILFVIFMVVVLPWISAVMESNIGVVNSPDTSLIYGVEAFYQMLSDYGHDGRMLYILIRWTFDLIYPLVYGLFLFSLTIYLMPKERSFKLLIYLPLIGMLFDYLENIVATFHMAIYPERVVFLVYVLQGFSLLKWLFIGLSFLAVIYLLINKIIQRFKHTD